MATKSDSPQVAALLKTAERKFGHPVRTPSDFLLLADKIEATTGEHISDSTIKRLYKPSLGYDTVSERTLNVIAQYIGFEHNDAFVADLAVKGLAESDMTNGEDSIKASDLNIGVEVEIAWMPDRVCRLRYLGDRKFEALECLNSKIKPGDTFYCTSFSKGRKLYVDDLVHEGEIYESYGMGTEHGLIRVSVINKTPKAHILPRRASVPQSGCPRNNKE